MVTLVIIDDGSKLHKDKELLKITYGYSGKPASFVPVDVIDSIIIDAKVNFTSGAIEIIRENQIMVYWMEKNNRDMILLPFYNNGLIELRRAQYLSYNKEKAYNYATNLILSASENKLTTLRKIKRNTELGDTVSQSIDELSQYLENVEIPIYFNMEIQRSELMSIEALATKIYYSGLRSFLNSLNWDFEKRTRRPAQDEINSLLNYGYAILKSQVSGYLSIVGFDIYGGFLHVDRPGRESLVLDVMEEFRQVIVDETIINLILKNEITHDEFIKTDSNVEIGKKCKSIYIPTLFSRLDLIYKNIPLRKHILSQCRKLAKYIKDETDNYKPFKNRVRLK